MDGSKNEFAPISLLLRIGVAFVFLYAAIASFIEPYAWIGYLPAFMQGLIPATFLLPIFSATEIILALWLLWGKGLFYSATIAALMLAAIVIFNFGALDIVFRDVAIFFSAVALIIIGYRSI